MDKNEMKLDKWSEDNRWIKKFMREINIESSKNKRLKAKEILP